MTYRKQSIRRIEKWNVGCLALEGGRNEKLLINRCKVSVNQDE